MFVNRLLDILVTVPCYRLWQRKTKGQILYHLPTSKLYPRLYKVSLGLGIVFSTCAILVPIMLVIKNGWTSLPQMILMPGLVFWLFFLFSVNHFVITEEGLYYAARFITWKDLHAFQWKEEGDHKLGLGAEAYILGLNVRGDSFPQWLEGYKFQRDQREDIDKLLSQCLPKAA